MVIQATDIVLQVLWQRAAIPKGDLERTADSFGSGGPFDSNEAISIHLSLWLPTR